ncbi:hypothetical protein PsorP6_016144 [Peronosclerospora sorghi]|uniref:Uncharacterized protein n=1 Tax=Peronosclerospora sorghi TaxID=230839 RepID=A0ACC0VPT5_9STRA|nr:hypothetical protein PsorP6_016144 [Peronosclerospora sorghi]
MEDPSGRHRFREFLATHMHKHKRPSPAPDEMLRTSDAGSPSSLPDYGVVLMEGSLKKRLAKMPVMHERYCVATWDHVDEHKYIMLRSYKNRKAYDAHPEKPSSVHILKRISSWDGKTGFHRYQHAFIMEMSDRKLYQCIAPCASDKNKWLELMANPVAFINRGRGKRIGSDGDVERRRRSGSAFSADARKPRAYTDVSASESKFTNSRDENEHPAQDQLFRATMDASIDSPGLQIRDTNEPVDWGLYGEKNELASSKFDMHDDAKPVLLEEELLDAREEAKTLDSDNFLFEETGASRFGTVIVKNTSVGNDEDDGEFVDEEFLAREAQKENEKKKKRWAQKLESNRDLYAEMAAARLAGMRKDARHPKKRSDRRYDRPSICHEDMEIHDDIQSMVEDGEAESVAEVEELNQRRSSTHSRHRLNSNKNSSLGSETASIVNGEYAQSKHEENEEEEEYTLPTVGVPNQLTTAEVTETESTEVEIPVVESEEAEELRQLKKKHRAERRAKKRLMKEKEEEERIAREAAELARAHREEQRAREEAKAREEQEKRMKQERRVMKEKLKREKSKQRQAEAELHKLVVLKQEEEERRERECKEKKEKRKMSKKKKYTSPTERIHGKEERKVERGVEVASTAKHAEPEVSRALVVVDKSVDTEAAQESLEAPEPTPVSGSSSTASRVQAENPVVLNSSATSAVPVSYLPSVVPPTATAAPDHSTPSPPAMFAPLYQISPPPFAPSYPPGHLSMPAYGLAATFGAFPPFYVAPYSYGGPLGVQPGLMRSNVGYVTGLSAMHSFGPAAGPAPSPSSQDSAEPMIGPQLPHFDARAAVSSAGNSAPSLERSSLGKSPLLNLPELPDVIEF